MSISANFKITQSTLLLLSKFFDSYLFICIVSQQLEVLKDQVTAEVTGQSVEHFFVANHLL